MKTNVKNVARLVNGSNKVIGRIYKIGRCYKVRLLGHWLKEKAASIKEAADVAALHTSHTVYYEEK